MPTEDRFTEDDPRDLSLEDELYASHLFGVTGRALKVRPQAKEPQAPKPGGRDPERRD